MRTHLTPLALAVAAALAGASPPTGAGVVVTGPYWSLPSYGGSLNGPGLNLPGQFFWFAAGAPGSFAVTAGATVDLAGFAIGADASGVSTLSGAGTRVSLHGSGGVARLSVGDGTGTGTLTIDQGALLDARASAAACQGTSHFCGTWVGNGAGSTGTLTVSGTGSEARLLGTLNAGNLDVRPGFGRAGASSQARVDVLAGGVLLSQDALIATSWLGPLANGQERSIAAVTVDGAGSLWRVEANTVTGAAAGATFASGPLATASLTLSGGGALEVAGSATQEHSVTLGEGGSFTGRVTGANSRLWLDAAAGNGWFFMAENGGTARLDVDSGGSIGGATTVHLGKRGGGQAVLNIDAGGTADFSRADVNVGNAATGSVNVSAGGRLLASQLNIGVDYQTIGGAATGRVVLDGAGSVLTLQQVGSHRLLIGGNGGGDGALTISGGALLDGTLNAAPCAGRWCGSIIGQTAGDTGRLTVTGAGSTARLMGGLQIAEVSVARPGVEGWGGGILNGSTHARVEVLAGGRLETEWVAVGGGQTASQAGGERSFAELVVNGAGSQWLIGGTNTTLNLARSGGAETNLTVSDGGLLRVAGSNGSEASMNLIEGGGRSVTTVTGAGSRLEITGAVSRLSAGHAAGGDALLLVKDGGALVQTGNGPTGSYLDLGMGRSTGRLEVLSGGKVSGMAGLSLGDWDNLGGAGTVLVSGAGSVLSTRRDPTDAYGQIKLNRGSLSVLDGGTVLATAMELNRSSGSVAATVDASTFALDGINTHRLRLEDGSLVVSSGGVLDAAVNRAACVGHWCGAFLGYYAGANVDFTVTGAGSRASFLSNFIVGGSYATAPPATTDTRGTPGAASAIGINVLGGGLLETETVNLGYGPQGGTALGTEAATVRVALDGAGSRWVVNAGTQAGPTGATSFSTGVIGGAHTDVSVAITNGARLELYAQPGQTANLQLARDGGQTTLSIVGAGSALEMSGGTTRTVLVGRNDGQASLLVMDGGRLGGASNVVVGLNQGGTAASGFLMLDGAQTRGQIAGDVALLRVGVGAWGNTQLSDGAQLSVAGNQSAFVTVGSYNNQAGGGMLTLTGPGTRLDVQTGGGSASSNASMTVGATWGLVQVDDGAQLRLFGGHASTPAQPMTTTLTVGSFTTLAGSPVAGIGLLNVSGSGSRVEVAGADARLLIGIGGVGQATVDTGGALASSYLGIGGSNGQGRLTVNAGRIDLAGQWTSQVLGPRLAIGYGNAGWGHLTLEAGSTVLLDGRGGPDRAALVLGGVTNTPLGTGRLVSSGGSSITLLGAGSALFGQTGSGFGDLSGASRLDLDGGTLFIGRYAGATGELHLREASQAFAGTALVGASAAGVDGGQGWLQVTSGSTLHATRLDIGGAGLLSGSGLLDVALLTNRGTINPGDSPGTLRLTGDFTNQTGGRLVLEVEDDGHGSFVTDRLEFGTGASLDLSGLQIEFRFLGATDPNAFQASGGFQIDSFLRQGSGGLDHALLGSASYSATSASYQFTSFNFSADGGAVFQAQAVPEPGTWMLFAAGLGLGAWLRQRRGQQA